MKAWQFVAAGCLLAGCAVPTVGTVTPAPEPKTAPESPLVSPACRQSLEVVAGGPDLLNVTDVVLGALAVSDPYGETAGQLSAFVWGAAQLGVTGCP